MALDLKSASIYVLSLRSSLTLSKSAHVAVQQAPDYENHLRIFSAKDKTERSVLLYLLL